MLYAPSVLVAALLRGVWRVMTRDHAQSRRSRQGVLCVMLGLSLVWPVAASGEDAPNRIVSVNMCADQLLLALADRQQIAALSWNANRPSLSFFADRAEGIALTRGSAEDVILRKPDLVISGLFAGSASKGAMSRAGLRVEDLGIPSTPLEAADQIAAFGARIGHAARGETEAGRLRQALATARQRAPQQRPKALYVQRRGLVTGGGTMMDALLQAAGFDNAITADGFSRISIEQLAVTEADVLILDGRGLRADGDAADQGASILAHPVMAQRFPETRRIIVPQAEIVCAGPPLIVALERLSKAAGMYRSRARDDRAHQQP